MHTQPQQSIRSNVVSESYIKGYFCPDSVFNFPRRALM